MKYVQSVVILCVSVRGTIYWIVILVCYLDVRSEVWSREARNLDTNVTPWHWQNIAL